MVSVKAHSVCICPPAISFEFLATAVGFIGEPTWWRKDELRTRTHNHFTALFPGLPAWAGARRNLLDFMVQGKITEADTPTIWMGATPSELISDPPPSPPPFLRQIPFCCNPPNLSWLGTGTGMCWIAYSVVWLRMRYSEWSVWLVSGMASGCIKKFCTYHLWESVAAGWPRPLHQCVYVHVQVVAFS